MDVLLLGLVWDIYSALCMALNTLFFIFLNLAETSTKLFDTSVLLGNIYIVMSVIMIFYFAINLITYLVSPDKVIGKNSSGIKIITNVIITIALIVFTPTIFSISRDLQTAIISENVLGKIILSDKDASDNEYTSDTFLKSSYTISKNLTRAFLTPVEENDEDPLYLNPFMLGESMSMTSLKQYAQDTVNYKFNWAIALVSVVVLCLVIFSSLFDISLRIIKLMVFELISPIPIITYSMPNKKNNVFSNWVHQCTNTYLSLFIRMAMIYFAIYLIQQLDTSEFYKENPIIFVFIIIGMLLFIRELPNIIKNIFGIQLDGNFSLNPMNRIRQVPLLGRGVETIGAGVGGLVTGAALGYRASGGFDFKGIYSGFKNDGFKGGMKNLGTNFGTVGKSVGKSAGLGTLYGSRAGWKQVPLGGTNEKIKNTAYSTGASSVAQAITGSDKATFGVFDQLYNNIGTELNKPNYEQQKKIEKAEKAYNQEVENMSVLKDSQREIQSNLRISVARRNNLKLQLDTIDNNINTVTSSRNNRVSTATAPIDSQIAQAESNFRNALATANPDSIKYKQQLDNLKQQKIQIEQQVDTQIQQEIETLRTQKTTVERQYSTANAEVTEYGNQYREVTKEIGRGAITKDVHGKDLPTDPTTGKPMTFEATNKTKDIAAAKKNIDDEKDKLKEMNGPYMKNK